MATIYNSELTKELTKGARLQTSKDVIPSQIADKVVPVMETNPRLVRVCNIAKRSTATNAANATIYTTPSDRDFFITSAMISLIKDATSQSTQSYIQYTDPSGQAVEILLIRGITLTAQTAQMSINFNFPLPVKRGTVIGIYNDNAAANISAAATITGYVEETSNA